MKRGPKPVPKPILQLRGSWRANRGVDACSGDRCPKAPKWLKGASLEEWRRVAPRLFKAGLLSPVDVTSLAGYCEAFATYRAAREICEKEGYTFKVKGRIYKHPSATVMNEAWRWVREGAAAFGMSPSDRNGVRASKKPTKEDEKGKFFKKKA